MFRIIFIIFTILKFHKMCSVSVFLIFTYSMVYGEIPVCTFWLFLQLRK